MVSCGVEDPRRGLSRRPPRRERARRQGISRAGFAAIHSLSRSGRGWRNAGPGDPEEPHHAALRPRAKASGPESQGGSSPAREPEYGDPHRRRRGGAGHPVDRQSQWRHECNQWGGNTRIDPGAPTGATSVGQPQGGTGDFLAIGIEPAGISPGAGGPEAGAVASASLPESGIRNSESDNWLDLSPAANADSTPSGISTPWHPAVAHGGGAALPPRGGSGNGAQAAVIAGVRGQVSPFRVPAPQNGGSGSGAAGAAGSAALLAAVAGASGQQPIAAAPIAAPAPSAEGHSIVASAAQPATGESPERPLRRWLALHSALAPPGALGAVPGKLPVLPDVCA